MTLNFDIYLSSWNPETSPQALGGVALSKICGRQSWPLESPQTPQEMLAAFQDKGLNYWKICGP